MEINIRAREVHAQMESRKNKRTETQRDGRRDKNVKRSRSLCTCNPGEAGWGLVGVEQWEAGRVCGGKQSHNAADLKQSADRPSGPRGHLLA